MTTNRLIRTSIIIAAFAATCSHGVLRGQDESATSQQRRVVLEQRAQTLLIEMKRSLTELERHLRQLPENERKIVMARLGWAPFSSELEKSAPEINLLRAFSKRLYEPFEKVPLETAIRLRNAIDEYTEVTRVAGHADLDAEIRRRQVAVDRLLNSAERLDTVRLGEHLDWLTTAGVSVEVGSVRQDHSHANIRLDIPKSIVKEQIQQLTKVVEQTQYVTNTVLGIPISGEAHTSGTATATLLPDNNAAGFRIDFRGVINAPANVAVRDPVVIYSTGQTTFSASTSITWEGLRFAVGEANAVCETSSEITGVAVTRQPLLRAAFLNRLISRAAWRRAEQQREQGEAAASQLAEARLEEALNEQASESVDELNDQLADFVTRPLRQVGMLPAIQAVMNPSAIHVSLLQQGPGRLAGTPRPPRSVGEDEFALYLHESALTSFMQKSAGGAVWSDRKFANLQKALIGDNSYELRIGLHPRWQVTLDWSRPLATRFNKDSIVIQLNAESLTIEDNHYAFPFSVEATYVFETTPPSLGFARVGDMRFSWTGGQPPESDERQMLSSFIRGKFAGLLLDEFYLDGLRAPSGGGLWGKLGSFNARDAESADGWMLVKFAALSDE